MHVKEYENRVGKEEEREKKEMDLWAFHFPGYRGWYKWDKEKQPLHSCASYFLKYYSEFDESLFLSVSFSSSC